MGSNLGGRRERKGSPLLNSWRLWCDACAAPTVVVVKGGGGGVEEMGEGVWVDVATMRGEFEQFGGEGLGGCLGRLDEVVGGVGRLEGEWDSAECASEEMEDYATWRLPEMWVKYDFHARVDARNEAKRIAGLCGLGGREVKKSIADRARRQVKDVDDGGGWV